MKFQYRMIQFKLITIHTNACEIEFQYYMVQFKRKLLSILPLQSFISISHGTI